MTNEDKTKEECEHNLSTVIINHPSGAKIGDKMCIKCNLLFPSDFITKKMEEFEKLVEMPFNYESAQKTLYGEEAYPENMYELSPLKVKNFLFQSILQAQEVQKEQTRKEIEKLPQ